MVVAIIYKSGQNGTTGINFKEVPLNMKAYGPSESVPQGNTPAYNTTD